MTSAHSKLPHFRTAKQDVARDDHMVSCHTCSPQSIPHVFSGPMRTIDVHLLNFQALPLHFHACLQASEAAAAEAQRKAAEFEGVSIEVSRSGPFTSPSMQTGMHAVFRSSATHGV